MTPAAQATHWNSAEHTATDLASMNVMLARLRAMAATLESLPAAPRPATFNSVERDGRHHRVVVSRAEPLLEGADLSVVAFFGLKSPTADAEVLARVDLELIEEL